ncbi:hypothetical protein NLJ89_g2267 [Agrocybe chaxingu]|uniref:Uncharacterized protein n=1 Tax=Agrocybe chaxingu TaxID=84603 RepID=A0A9W8K6Y4_9AGAR|nr:hypothetical protein NLJ89_g2267 [Agrocybe chaxingu]
MPKDQIIYLQNVKGGSSALMKQVNASRFCHREAPANSTATVGCLSSSTPLALTIPAHPDQCEAPPNFQELADISGRGLNFNGSVCLNNVCLCIFENTPYIAYGVGGEFIDIVSRVGLYCDSATQVCIQNKLLGDACTADKECESWNCLSTGVCGVPAATPRHFGVWVYVLVALGIIGGMAGTLTGLYVTHRKQREIERAKRAQYWKEQGGDYSRDDDSQTPILHSAETQKSSGLRHYMANNDSSDFDDALEMRGTKDNRF